mmetsp:Transcript_904/g.3071  ORF Transcript_904/g.3071 Transcript_904/m.3071 type:complete len:474 (+) Transcript_904:395-1816(+)
MVFSPTKVVVVAGPTAIGKSSLALSLCEALGGEIVSADSVQLYRGLDVGSNKPDLRTRRLARHHLVDVAEPEDIWSAGRWLRAASSAVDDCARRGRVPVVVGGTMMYARWLVRGPPDAPKATAAAVEEADRLLRDARDRDDWTAGLDVFRRHRTQHTTKSFSANDWYRLSRALEIELDTINYSGDDDDDKRTKMTTTQRDSSSSSEVSSSDVSFGLADPARYDARCFFLGPRDRVALFRGIDRRCDDMLRRGLVTEVADLLSARRLPPDSPASRAIGYRQVIDYLENKRLLDDDGADDDGADYVDFCKRFATATRNYAADQIKWYRRDDDFSIVLDDHRVADRVIAAFHLPRADYDAWRTGDDQAAERKSLVADTRVMRTYAAHPPEAATDPAVLKDQLDRVDAALAKLRRQGPRLPAAENAAAREQHTQQNTTPALAAHPKRPRSDFRLAALQSREKSAAGSSSSSEKKKKL